jgi:hypothetical protein
VLGTTVVTSVRAKISSKRSIAMLVSHANGGSVPWTSWHDLLVDLGCVHFLDGVEWNGTVPSLCSVWTKNYHGTVPSLCLVLEWDENGIILNSINYFLN